MRKVMSLLVILSLCFTMSCQKQKAKEEEGMFTKAEYEDIEKRTQRKIIHVDTTTLYPSEKSSLEASLEVERTALIKRVKLALGYEMGNGYEIIQFRSYSNSCHYSCPDLYVQLTTDEYKHSGVIQSCWRGCRLSGNGLEINYWPRPAGGERDTAARVG